MVPLPANAVCSDRCVLFFCVANSKSKCLKNFKICLTKNVLFFILDDSLPTLQTVATLPTPPSDKNDDNDDCPTVLYSFSSVSGTVLSLMSVSFALAVRHGFLIPALLNVRTTVKFTYTDRHRVMLLVVTELTKTNSPIIVYLLGLLPPCPPLPVSSVPIPTLMVESSTTPPTTAITTTTHHTPDVASCPLSFVLFPSSTVSVPSSSSSESPSPVKPTVLVNPTFCHPLSDTSSLL